MRTHRLAIAALAILVTAAPVLAQVETFQGKVNIRNTSTKALCVGADLNASPTTCTGEINGGALVLSGIATVNGAGLHTFSASSPTFNAVTVRNTNNGNGAFAYYSLGNDAVSEPAALRLNSSTFTTAAQNVQSGLKLENSAAGGIQLVSSHASGPLDIYTGGTTRRGQITAAGLFSWETLGAHSFSASATGVNSLTIRHTSAGATNAAALYVANNQSATRGQLTMLSSTWTNSAPYLQDALVLDSAGVNGQSISASDAAGAIRFYSGGATERGRVHASGGFSWGDTTDPGATNFRVAGTLTVVGSVGTLKHADGTAAAPTVVGASATTSGLFWSGVPTVGIAVGGSSLVSWGGPANGNVTQTLTGGLSLPSAARGTGANTGQRIVIGSNNSGSGAAGILALQNLSGVSQYLWADASGTPGVLRISATPPEEDGTPSDTSGTVVGAQTSTRASKNILGDYTANADALTLLLRTPLYRFTYKGGAYNNTVFVGITTDDSPEFGMDLGRSFNPVSAFGYTVAAIKQLQAEIDQLKAERGRRTNAQSAEAMGGAIAAAFALAQARGMSFTEALKMVAPAVEALERQLAETGLSGGAAFEDIRRLVDLAADAVAGPALDAVGDLNETLMALYNSGLLTDDMFQGLSGQVADTYNRLVSQGKNGNDVLRSMQPTLQTIWELMTDEGLAVDDTTRALVDQAVEAGIVGESHRSAQEKMMLAAERTAAAVEAIARALGAVPPAADGAAKGVQNAINGLPKKITIPVEFPGQVPDIPRERGGGGDGNPPEFASGSGGFRNFRARHRRAAAWHRSGHPTERSHSRRRRGAHGRGRVLRRAGGRRTGGRGGEG